jgi:hypothetical protein
MSIPLCFTSIVSKYSHVHFLNFYEMMELILSLENLNIFGLAFLCAVQPILFTRHMMLTKYHLRFVL